jgi:hypothetical protein
VSALTIFGVASVSAMLVFYALEDRSSSFVLLFACACAAASGYGFLQGAWPFGVVEAIWTAVAVRRWRQRQRFVPARIRRPIVCDMSALSPDERIRYNVLRLSVSSATQETIRTSRGLRLRLDTSVPPRDVAEWLALEHRCCPFLHLRLDLAEDQDAWVELTGSSLAAASFISEEFASMISRPN